jgi:hypothetical protein
MPTRCTTVRCTSVECTPVRFTTVVCTPIKSTLRRCTSIKYTSVRCAPCRRTLYGHAHLYENRCLTVGLHQMRDCANHRLNVDGEERCRRAPVDLVRDKIGSPRFTWAHAAQGGVTLGPEQGEPGGEFQLSWQDLSRLLDASRKRLSGMDFQQEALRLKNLCGGLIGADHSSAGSTVQFMHQTVKDFVNRPALNIVCSVTPTLRYIKMGSHFS